MYKLNKNCQIGSKRNDYRYFVINNKLSKNIQLYRSISSVAYII